MQLQLEANTMNPTKLFLLDEWTKPINDQTKHQSMVLRLQECGILKPWTTKLNHQHLHIKNCK